MGKLWLKNELVDRLAMLQQTEAIDRVYTSPIYEKLSDAATGLFFQSPRYILSYL